MINTIGPKRRSHSCPRTVCAAIRKILRGQGWPMHVMTGRYQASCSSQTGTEGYEISKVGCSKRVSLFYYGSYANGSARDVPRETRAERLCQAVEFLSSAGYSIDSRGYIECESYDECDSF